MQDHTVKLIQRELSQTKLQPQNTKQPKSSNKNLNFFESTQNGLLQNNLAKLNQILQQQIIDAGLHQKS